MVDVAQLVRASDCGSEGRGFEPLLPPARSLEKETFFVFQEAPSRLSGDSFSIVRRLLFGCPGVYGPSSLQFPGSLHNALPDTLNPTPFSPKPFRFQHNSIPGRPVPPQPQRKPISPRLVSSANPLRAALERPSERVNLRRSPPSEASPPQQPQKKRENVAILPLCFRVGFAPPLRTAPPHPLDYLR